MNLIKNLRRLCLVLLLAVVLTIPAFADMGPKPAVHVSFTGCEGREYAVTLLSFSEGTGPYHAVTPGDPTASGYDGSKNYDALSRYQDTDGYHFLGHYENCADNSGYSWEYMRPKTFKVLVYFPDTETYAVSESITCNTFDARYTAAVDGETVTVTEEGKWFRIPAFLLRLLLTVAVELGLAVVFFGTERKMLCCVLIVNLVTQLLLNLMLYGDGYQSVLIFYILRYGAIEVAIFLLEAVVYVLYFPKVLDRKVGASAFVYSLAANACSYILGWVISSTMTQFIP